jgi:AraC family transcriptional regulator
MVDHAGASATSPLSARISGGAAIFKTERSWSGGRLYGAIKHWRGAEAELLHRRRQHTLILTLGGSTDLTGTKISGSPHYEGRDRPGCVTFVPSGAERRGWYRNADMSFLVLLVEPDFVGWRDLGRDSAELRPFTNHRDPLLERVLCSLATEMQSNGAGLPSVYAEHAAGLLMAHIMQSTQGARASSERGLSQTSLRLVLEFVEANLHRDLSLSELGSLAGMGPDVFARNFKRRVGVPPYRYVIERRISRAQYLLAENKRSIADIALAVGFSSQSHFTTQFGKLLHMSPAAYRARQRA